MGIGQDMVYATLDLWYEDGQWFVVVEAAHVTRAGRAPVGTSATAGQARQAASRATGIKNVAWVREDEVHRGQGALDDARTLERVTLRGGDKAPKQNNNKAKGAIGSRARAAAARRAKKRCGVEGCKRAAESKDLCPMHYFRWKACGYPPQQKWVDAGGPKQTQWFAL